MMRPNVRKTLFSCLLVGSALPVAVLMGQDLVKKRGANGKTAIAKVAPDAAEMQPLVIAAPGSPEAARLAAFAAEVKAGRVPIARFESVATDDHSKGGRVPDSVATEIVPQKKVAGEMLHFQKKLSQLFAAADPIPASRLSHFAWLKNHPEVKVLGWYGVVTGAEAQADSSVVVNIEFHAKTHITGKRAIIRDLVNEMYLVADGAMQLIDTDAASVNPRVQVVESF